MRKSAKKATTDSDDWENSQ